MVSLAQALVGLSAVALVLAVITNFFGIFLTTAEGYARASMSLALIAIALVVCFRDKTLT